MVEKPDWQIKYEQFWAAYPFRVTDSGKQVKVDRVACEVWFRVKKPDDETFAQIMQGLEAYIACQSPKYIMNPERWLRQKHWTDEYSVKAKPRVVVAPQRVLDPSIVQFYKDQTTEKLKAWRGQGKHVLHTGLIDSILRERNG